MKRNLSGWGVTIAGLLLAAAGAGAMWTGWDMILIERGWSLFIAGAVAVSGGVVTIALGRVIASLARLAERPMAVTAPAPARETAVAPEPAAPPPPVAVAPASKIETRAPPEPPVVEEPAPAPLPRQRYGYSRGSTLSTRPLAEPTPPPPAPEPPTEVDRYSSGGATYVMMSDGSVEVYGPNGVKRYASLAALKAEAALHPL